MSVYGCNMNLELQQRAVEYNSIIRNHGSIKDGLFEQMPVIEMKSNPYANGDENANDAEDQEAQELQLKRQQEEAAKTLLDIFSEDASPPANTAPVFMNAAQPASVKPAVSNNFDLLGLMDDGPSAAPVSTSTVSSSQPANVDFDSLFNVSASKPAPVATAAVSNNFDLLMSGPSTNTTKMPSQSTSNGLNDLLGLGAGPTSGGNTQNGNDLLNLFMGSTPAPSNPVSSSMSTDNILASLQAPPALKQQQQHQNQKSNASLVVYEKNDLKITLEPAAGGNHTNAEQHFLQLKAENLGLLNTITDVLFSAAVPKTMQMQLSTPNTSIIQPLDSLIQTLAISNPKRVSIAGRDPSKLAQISTLTIFYSRKNCALGLK